jgi:hypothetical protein
MRRIVLSLVILVTAFTFLTAPSFANDEYTIEKTLADAGHNARVNVASKAAFCAKPRSNTREKCLTDYDDLLVDYAELVVKQLHYLVAKKRGAPKELLDVLEMAWKRAQVSAKRAGDRLDELYWFDTSASVGTISQATSKSTVSRAKGKQ